MVHVPCSVTVGVGSNTVVGSPTTNLGRVPKGKKLLPADWMGQGWGLGEGTTHSWTESAWAHPASGTLRVPLVIRPLHNHPADTTMQLEMTLRPTCLLPEQGV